MGSGFGVTGFSTGVVSREPASAHCTPPGCSRPQPTPQAALLPACVKLGLQHLAAWAEAPADPDRECLGCARLCTPGPGQAAGA